ncbi:MAG: FKBP-type peptidyl-prolyl cis-trans isomerase [Lachnospiraceae bacterium]|nr:FKBP-type peptidyl-prolyl cis-trans isomerase [Lachnospiraceae bacterium]
MGTKTDEKSAENISKSMQKRIDRAKQTKKAKRSAMTGRIISYVILALVAAGIIYLISAAAIKAVKRVTPSSDYSKYLDANGYVKDVAAGSCVTLPEYKGITIKNSDIEYTDEEVQSDIDDQVNQHTELSTDTDKKIEDGDKINLDYVGTVDGVEFAGGNSNGQGSDLTIGSGTFVDDFEQQLIGAGVGDNVTVNVTFPDDYQSADLAGKDAKFECTINGIYVAPEFTDDFVAEYLSDKASTVEEYKKYLKDTHYETNLNDWIENYLRDNTTVTNYPAKYLKQLKSIQKYSEMESFNIMKDVYAQYGMTYNDFYDYQGKSEEEYDASLDETCKETEKDVLTYQAIMEKEGVRSTIDDYKAHIKETEGGDEAYADRTEQYGDPYLIQSLYKDKAIQIVKDNAKFE